MYICIYSQIYKTMANKWSVEEVEILNKHYEINGGSYCKELIKDRSIKAIRKKAKELGLSINESWSEKQLELLKYHWQYSNMKTLLEIFPNRTYNSLMLQAKRIGVKSLIKRKRKGSLKFLDELNCENSYYWWGFIMADGHLSAEGDLVISLSIKDLNHLQELADIIGCSIKINQSITSYSVSKFCTLRIKDLTFGKKWYDLLSMVSQKTYNPPNLKYFYKKEYLIYFLIGLIDGDGSIWRSRVTKTSKGSIALRLEMHSSWEETLKDLSSKIKEFYDIDFNVKINSKGFVKMEISSKDHLIKLYEYTKNKNIKPLERKWEHVGAFMSQ